MDCQTETETDTETDHGMTNTLRARLCSLPYRGQAGHWFGQCSRGLTVATAGLIRPNREGFGGCVQVNITAIIRHREAKVSQNPNVSEGLNVTYSDSRARRKWRKCFERARGPLFGPGKTQPDTSGLPQHGS